MLRARRMSPRTERSYLHWMRRFWEFHGRRDPRGMGAEEVTAFLNHLATAERVAASTQNQALAAILFLYRHVLLIDLPWLDGLIRARKPRRLPAVLSVGEVRVLLGSMDGVTRLIATLLYGSGLRLMEACQLRIKDIDFAGRVITVREGKGAKDRLTMLPAGIVKPLELHLRGVREQHRRDLAAGAGWVALPFALDRKYPKAGQDWAWQWVFPATRTFLDRETGQRRRHHLHETVVQKAVREAALAAQIPRRVTCHTLRHSFATHLLEAGSDIRTIQELLGHRDVATTMIHTHVLNCGPAGVESPADRWLSE